MFLVTMHIKRIEEDRYEVRMYDPFQRARVNEMSGKRLQALLTLRHILDRTPVEVLDCLDVGDETTVEFRRAA